MQMNEFWMEIKGFFAMIPPKSLAKIGRTKCVLTFSKYWNYRSWMNWKVMNGKSSFLLTFNAIFTIRHLFYSISRTLRTKYIDNFFFLLFLKCKYTFSIKRKTNKYLYLRNFENAKWNNWLNMRIKWNIRSHFAHATHKKKTDVMWIARFCNKQK